MRAGQATNEEGFWGERRFSDAVMLVVDPVEAVMGGFLERVFPMALEKEMAVIGMKPLGGSRLPSPRVGVTAHRLIRCVLQQPVSLLVVGCSSPQGGWDFGGCGKG